MCLLRKTLHSYTSPRHSCSGCMYITAWQVRGGEASGPYKPFRECLQKRVDVCLRESVCVCERERERESVCEREREKECVREREKV